MWMCWLFGHKTVVHPYRFFDRGASKHIHPLIKMDYCVRCLKKVDK